MYAMHLYLHAFFSPFRDIKQKQIVSEKETGEVRMNERENGIEMWNKHLTCKSICESSLLCFCTMPVV